MRGSKNFLEAISSLSPKDSKTHRRPVLSCDSLPLNWLRFLNEEAKKSGKVRGSMTLKSQTIKNWSRFRQRGKLRLDLVEVLPLIQEFVKAYDITVTVDSVVDGMVRAGLLPPEEEINPLKYREPYPCALKGTTIIINHYKDIEDYLN